MTRKHFNIVANSFRTAVEALDSNANNTAALSTIMIAINAFCDSAKRENPRFDRDRFFQACGL